MERSLPASGEVRLRRAARGRLRPTEGNYGEAARVAVGAAQRGTQHETSPRADGGASTSSERCNDEDDWVR